MRTMTLVSMCFAFICSAAAWSQDGTSKSSNQPPSGLVIKSGVYKTQWAIPEKPQPDWGAAPSFGECTEKVPPSLKGKPKFVSQHPMFGTLLFTSDPNRSDIASSMIFALDESNGTGKGYDALYLDIDGTRDLSNARKSTGELAPPVPKELQAEADHFGYFTTAFLSAAKLPYNKLFPRSGNSNAVLLDIGLGRTGDQWALFASTRGLWQGEVETNRGKIPFRLMDLNRNGRYDERRGQPDMLVSHGDTVFFDWTGSGKFEVNEDAPPFAIGCELLPINLISGQFYILTPSASGDQLQVTDYAGPMVKLIVEATSIHGIPVKARTLRLTGPCGFLDCPPDQIPNIPAGRYGIFVRMSAVHDGKRFAPFYEVEKDLTSTGKPMHITIGGELTPEIKTVSPGMKLHMMSDGGVSLALHLPDRGNIGFDLDLADDAGTGLEPGHIGLPTGLVVNQAGKTVAHGTSDSWWGASEWFLYIRNLRDLTPGEYTIDASIDIGPFGGIEKVSSRVTLQEGF